MRTGIYVGYNRAGHWRQTKRVDLHRFANARHVLPRLLLFGVLCLLSACIQPIHREGASVRLLSTKVSTSEVNTLTQSIGIEGMTVSWHFAEGFIDITATAPTRGWVAVGFNRRDEIVGTNLVMGAV